MLGEGPFLICKELKFVSPVVGRKLAGAGITSQQCRPFSRSVITNFPASFCCQKSHSSERCRRSRNHLNSSSIPFQSTKSPSLYYTCRLLTSSWNSSLLNSSIPLGNSLPETNSSLTRSRKASSDAKVNTARRAANTATSRRVKQKVIKIEDKLTQLLRNLSVYLLNNL